MAHHQTNKAAKHKGAPTQRRRSDYPTTLARTLVPKGHTLPFHTSHRAPLQQEEKPTMDEEHPNLIPTSPTGSTQNGDGRHDVNDVIDTSATTTMTTMATMAMAAEPLTRTGSPGGAAETSLGDPSTMDSDHQQSASDEQNVSDVPVSVDPETKASTKETANVVEDAVRTINLDDSLQATRILTGNATRTNQLQPLSSPSSSSLSSPPRDKHTADKLHKEQSKQPQQPQLRSRTSSEQAKLTGKDHDVPAQYSSSKKEDQAQLSPTRIPRVWANADELRSTNGRSICDESTMPAPPLLGRRDHHEYSVARPGAFQRSSSLSRSNSEVEAMMRDNRAAITHLDGPIVAELAATDEEIAGRIKDQLQKQFDERVELEIQERMEQRASDAVAAVAVLEVPTGAVAKSMNSMESSTTSSTTERGSAAQRSKRRAYFGVAAVCLVIIIGVVIVVLVLVGSLDESSNSRSAVVNPTDGQAGLSPSSPTQSPTRPPTQAPTQLPSQPPTQAPTSTMDVYVDRLLPILGHAPTFTKREAFEDADTPQYKAMEWLSRTYDIDQVRYDVTAEDISGSNSTELSVVDILDANDIGLRHLVERYAAAVFYFATGGPDWPSNPYGFLSQNKSICGWNYVGKNGDTGIYCNRNESAVEELLFSASSLDGALPDEVYYFSNMQFMWLEDNPFLTGTISSYIGTLSDMRSFDITATGFFGTIPSEIGHLKELYTFLTFGTSLGGSIPTEIGNAKALRWFSVFGTQVGGSLPSEMGRLAALTDLELGFSLIGGYVPSQLGNLKNLESIWLEDTSLIGNLDPILCLSDQAERYAFDADCGNDGDTPSPVACSCCTRCCVGGIECRDSWDSRPDPCHYGECVWCGGSRFAASCDKCVNLGNVTNATAREELCQASCAWDAGSATCGARTNFTEVAN